MALLLIVSVAICMTSCMKHQEASVSSNQNSSDHGDLVITPAGYMKKSNIHRLDSKNFRLSVVNGRFKKVSKATGQIVDDFGEAPTNPPVRKELPLGQKTLKVGPSTVVPGPLSNSNWACYGYLVSANYGSNNPIQSFSTTWSVPAAPPSYTGQALFLFEGAQNGTPGSATAILQPVLQFGATGAGGGNYWAITNWYVYNGGQSAIIGDLVEVSTGTVLTGTMQATLVAGGNYNYTSQFANYPTTDITVTNQPPLNYPVEAMEVSNWTTANDYPQSPTLYEAMHSMNIAIEGNAGFLLWQVADQFAYANEHAIVYSNSPSAGEIDLYWHAAFSNRTNYIDFSSGYTNQSGSITAFWKNQVKLSASVTLEPPGTYSVEIGLTGVTFTSNTSGSSPDVLTATSSLNNTTATFNMPNFYVNWSGSFTESNNYGSAAIYVAD